MKGVLPCSVALALCLAHGEALAQPRTDDAGALFRAGAAAFDARDYRRALENFQRVFALRGNADLLYNIYLCHRAMGDPSEAARALRRYLVARPDHPDRAQLTAVLSQLDAEARALSTATPTAAPPSATPPAATPPTTPPLGSVPPTSPAAPVTRGPGAGPWILMGTGAVLAGVGIGLMVTAGSSVDEASNASGERARQELLDGASTRHTLGIAAVGVGGAALLGGVLWQVLAPRRVTRVASLDAAPGGLGITLRARFP